jgi:beta-glucosidase
MTWPFQNPDLPLAQRSADLVARLTLDEKISQLLHDAPAIPRLGIPAYNWWNEALHGVARAGIATVFPQAIGMAAAWDDVLLHRVACAISDEGRAKHHAAVRRGERGPNQGLTFWSPNINIFRDPRWGRGQETYGEDPYLTARLGVAFVHGLQGRGLQGCSLQGDDPRYLKSVATPKHYAVHSGPEADRHHFDARVTPRDLWETYLPAFEACVVEAQAASVMGAYNRVNGEAACAGQTLLGDILRDRWQFDGYVVSDCGGIDDIYRHHRLVATAAEAAALALEAGCDLNCGETYTALHAAVAQGLISEATIERSLERLIEARLRLGMFDPPERVPYAQIGEAVIASAENRALCLEITRASLVLLRNEGGLLPLSTLPRTIAVIGPNADNPQALLGNYHGTPAQSTTPLAGIRARCGAAARVLHTPGCDLIADDRSGFDAAVALAQSADLVIFVGGLDQSLEGEEGEQSAREGWGDVGGGDRPHLELPAVQTALLRALHATGTPIVLVLLNGSPLALGWEAAHIPAIVEAWYPGQEGGRALAELLCGDFSPSGRLPVTFYQSADQLPPFDSYDMAGRTYRFFDGPVRWPFGHGLGYTTFSYSDFEQVVAGDGDGAGGVTVSADVCNTGFRAGYELVQLYLTCHHPDCRAPIRQLEGFRRLWLEPGERQRVPFTLHPRQLRLYNDAGERVVIPTAITASIGGGQPLPGTPCVSAPLRS